MPHHLGQINTPLTKSQWRDAYDRARAGELPDDATRLQYRLNVGYAAKLCVQAVERLMPVVGGRGLELHHAFQRAWRDVHAMRAHAGNNPERAAFVFGRSEFGLPPQDIRF